MAECDEIEQEDARKFVDIVKAELIDYLKEKIHKRFNWSKTNG